jgi:hypothetical protein
MNHLTIRKTLNKAFLKVKPQRSEINHFKAELKQLLTQINPAEHEEFNKNLLSDFLKNTFYAANHFINTKGRNDLVIHHENSAKSPVGVIIEAKRPENVAEMPTDKRPDGFSKPVRSENVDFDLNCKAIQELLLYYLRERITDKNDKIKHLIATDAHVWFVFDEQEFFKYFGNDKKLVKAFEEFERGTASGTKTDYFYKNIAQPAIEKVQNDLTFTYFDIRDFKNIVEADDKELDKKLIPLFKIFSPEHLLKLPFANDSNTLNKDFYNELLHIIGLYETETSKKTIERLPKGKRNAGSLLENTIEKLDNTTKIQRLKNAKQYGSTYDEQLENVALELVITWINRILFLKLLEAQLLSYHKGDKDFSFLNFEKLQDYYEVEVLFFEVLAKQTKDRLPFNQETFGNVPYLNSSLFEATELENETFGISCLRDKYNLPLHNATVLKNANGKRLTKERNTLSYLLAFLDAYDFSSEGSEDIQEQHKSIINAAVLGLIFEKINGYKDGSFFTPGFITMYMCRETLRRAVVQKFNENYDWNCENITDLYNEIRNRKAAYSLVRKEANELINSLKICDPAVGSGHFLVSALNELIAIKHDLGILQDENGKGFRDFRFEIENDELVVWDEEEDQLFKYNPNSKESKRIQKTLFHEKQTIIENCLFGVDINPNSVKICRLRLWIELLKNAYYNQNKELETLPNLDINIKCGNSLISRFALDVDLKKALSKHKISIVQYRNAVANYRNAKSKTEKSGLLELINKIKTDFKTSISQSSKEQRDLNKMSEDFYYKYNSTSLFEVELTKAQEKDKADLSDKIEQLKTKIADVENNVIFDNAFEWRFEFPEVLDDEGAFLGFDVVIGNPPYMYKKEQQLYFKSNYKVFEGRADLYEIFIERAVTLLKKDSLMSFILPNTILSNLYASKVRLFLMENTMYEICNFGMDVFKNPTVHVCILFAGRDKSVDSKIKIKKQIWDSHELNTKPDYLIYPKDLSVTRGTSFDISFSLAERALFKKIITTKTLSDICYIRQCIKTGNNSELTKYSPTALPEPWKKSLTGKNINRYQTHEKDLYVKYGDWLARNWNNTDFYERTKIVIRETGNQVIATLDDENRYILSSLYSVYFKEDNSEKYLKPLLGLLNSKATSFFIKKISYDLTAGAFTKVRTNQLGKLPIPESFIDNSEQLENLVTEILAQKQENPKADTSELESEIDAMVYKLYDLTTAEIELIEKG